MLAFLFAIEFMTDKAVLNEMRDVTRVIRRKWGHFLGQ